MSNEASPSTTAPTSEKSHQLGDPQSRKDVDDDNTTLKHDDVPILPTTAPQPAAIISSGKSRSWDAESIREFMSEVVDVDGSTGVLAAYCFMTGFVDAVSFTACFIWCAFQTGNTIQLSLALARLFSGEGQTSTFLMPDRQALASLSSFLGGSFFGRLGDRYNPKTRGWLSFATLMQAGLTMAAALCAWKAHQSGFTSSRADPSWTDAYGFLALAFASASMGLQAQVGTRMGSQFATTVVLTSVWVALVSDPVLFRAPTKIYPQRDYRMLAIASVFLGGFVGRALTGSIGPAATLGIGAGIRLFIAPAWFLVQKAKKKV